MLPFDNGAMMNFFFSRVSPLTASGHGRSRCHARLSASVSAADSPVMPEVDEDLVEDHPMQVVEHGPRQLAGSDAVHARAVTAAPGVGELRAVHRQSFPLREVFDFLRHRRTPVDDGAEGVEDERLYRRQWRGCRGALRTIEHCHPSSAKLNASYCHGAHGKELPASNGCRIAHTGPES